MSVSKVILDITKAPGGLQSARITDKVGSNVISTGSESVYVGEIPLKVMEIAPTEVVVADAIPPFEVIVYDKGFVKKNEMF